MIATARTPRIVAARKLTRSSARAQAGRFLAEGPQAVSAALSTVGDATGGVLEVFATGSGLARHPELVAVADSAGVAVTEVTDDAMAGLSETVTPQGVVALCCVRDVSLAQALRAQPRLVAVLAQVRDPGNAGTLVRTAAAIGADAVVFAGDSVDPYNGKCVRASAGSLFHAALVRGVPVTTAIDQLRAAGLRVLAADGAGDVGLDELTTSGVLQEPTAWVFGNEARGLPNEVAAAADVRVRIPINARVESLNVAAAAAICLYASAQEQRPGDPGDDRRREH